MNQEDYKTLLPSLPKQPGVYRFIDKEGTLNLDFENDVVGPSTVTHAGEVVNERVAATLS